MWWITISWLIFVILHTIACILIHKLILSFGIFLFHIVIIDHLGSCTFAFAVNYLYSPCVHFFVIVRNFKVVKTFSVLTFLIPFFFKTVVNCIFVIKIKMIGINARSRAILLDFLCVLWLCRNIVINFGIDKTLKKKVRLFF